MYNFEINKNINKIVRAERRFPTPTNIYIWQWTLNRNTRLREALNSNRVSVYSVLCSTVWRQCDEFCARIRPTHIVQNTRNRTPNTFELVFSGQMSDDDWLMSCATAIFCFYFLFLCVYVYESRSFLSLQQIWSKCFWNKNINNNNNNDC